MYRVNKLYTTRMTPEKIAAFKTRLEDELAQVQSELATVGAQNPKNSSDWEAKEVDMDVMNTTADENEAADKFEEYTENRAINDELEISFNAIKRALGKIEAGTYGICEVCSAPIEEERLEANPSARTWKMRCAPVRSRKRRSPRSSRSIPETNAAVELARRTCPPWPAAITRAALFRVGPK